MNKRLLQSNPSTIAVYFGINTNTISDNSTAIIAATSSATLTSNQFIYLDLLNNNVTGLPTLTSSTVDNVSYVGPNDISGSVTYGVGPNYFYIYNVVLTNNGLVYVIVGDNAVWPRAPVFSEIKTGSGPNGLPPVFFGVMAYKSSVASSGNLAWTSMTSGSYTVYMVASDDNPFSNANFGTIKSFQISHEVAAFEGYIQLLVLLLFIVFLE